MKYSLVTVPLSVSASAATTGGKRVIDARNAFGLARKASKIFKHRSAVQLGIYALQQEALVQHHLQTLETEVQTIEQRYAESLKANHPEIYAEAVGQLDPVQEKTTIDIPGF